jgi:hypothetical protein
LYRLFDRWRLNGTRRARSAFVNTLAMMHDQVWARIREEFQRGDIASSAIDSAELTILLWDPKDDPDHRLALVDSPSALIACLHAIAIGKARAKLQYDRHRRFFESSDSPIKDGVEQEVDNDVIMIEEACQREMRAQLKGLCERIDEFMGADKARRMLGHTLLHKEMGLDSRSIKQIAVDHGMSNRTVDRVLQQLRDDVGVWSIVHQARKAADDLRAQLRALAGSQLTS